jgi:hypothetical protein
MICTEVDCIGIFKPAIRRAKGRPVPLITRPRSSRTSESQVGAEAGTQLASCISTNLSSIETATPFGLWCSKIFWLRRIFTANLFISKFGPCDLQIEKAVAMFRGSAEKLPATGVLGLGARDPSNQVRNATGKNGNSISPLFITTSSLVRNVAKGLSRRVPSRLLSNTANKEGTRRQNHIPFPALSRAKADLNWLMRRSDVGV